MMPLLGRGIEPAPRWARTDYILVGTLTMVGLALRIPSLDQGLWIDELVTLFRYVRSPALEIINAVGAANNHVLYSLFAHYTVILLGESAWTLRLPALVFGVAAIPALYHLGWQVAGRKEAFLAALFMTLNYQFVWYSQNARGYTGLLLGAVLASILLIRLLASARPSAGLVSGYALVAALTVWMQLTAVFVILAHGLIWLVLVGKAMRAGRVAAAVPTFIALLLTGLITLALYAPFFTTKHGDFDTVAVSDTGSSVTTADHTGSVVSGELSWVLQEFVQGLQRSTPGSWPVLVIVVLVLLAGIGSYLRQGMVVAAMLLLPVLLTFLVIYLHTRFFFPRYLFGSAGFLLLLAVRGGFVSVGLCLPFLSRRSVLLMGSLVALAGTFQVPAAWKPKQDFDRVVEFMAHRRAPNDAVVCIAQTIFPLKVVLGMDCDAVNSVTELIRIEALHERTWLIYTLPDSLEAFAPEIWQRIQQPADYLQIKSFAGSLNGGDIIVLLKQPTPH